MLFHSDDVPGDAEDVKSMEKDIRKRFEIADNDKDGRLSKSEFSVFVHPDRHDEMLEHLVQDQLNRFDKDSDGKVSFDEYMSKYGSSQELHVLKLPGSLEMKP